jgi:hypothetical protein
MALVPLKVQRAYYLGKWLKCECCFLPLFNFLHRQLLNKEHFENEAANRVRLTVSFLPLPHYSGKYGNKTRFPAQ